MAIDKVTPQRLNTSVDARYRPNTDMSDALNVTFGDDHKSSAGDVTSGGDFGVLKPTAGNKAVEGSMLSSTSRIIGSVTDDVLGLIFFFVWSASAEEMGVWAYDRDGILPGSSADTYVEVYTSSRFAFPAQGFVDGDVVHIGYKDASDNDSLVASEMSKSVILYFTDNINEPKKLDVFKAMTNNDIGGYDLYSVNDLIKACPRTPLEPITFEFSTNSDRQASNFEKLPGMQFAYQFLYKGGVDSPISTYSKLAIPKEYLQQGVSTVANLGVNVCLLTVPKESVAAPLIKNITKEVEKIRLLVRFGNTGGFKVIEEIAPDDATNYLFYNDRVLYPVSEEETAMHFSGLPKKARAQAIVSNRLMYANYLEGFDSVDCNAVGVPVYKEAAQNAADLTIRVIPFLMQPLKTNTIASAFSEQKVAGYKIDTGGIPWDPLPIGSVINLQWAVNPDNNYNIYDYTNSFHGNKQVGSSEPVWVDGAQSFDTEDEANLGVEYQVHSLGLGVDKGNVLFGANSGVGFHVDDSAPAAPLYNEWVSRSPEDPSVEVVTPVVHGTSAAAPLIIKGGPLNFSLRFKTNYSTASGQDSRDFVKKAIINLLTGSGDMPEAELNDVMTPFATPVSLPKGTSEYSFNLQMPEAGESPQIWDWSYTESGNHELVSALGGIVPQVQEGPLDPSVDFFEPFHHNSPVGYIAVTKADVKIGLVSMNATMDARYPQDEFYHDAYLALEVQSLENIEIKTCIPVLDRKASTSSFPGNAQKTLFDLDLSHWEVYHPDDVNGNLDLSESYKSLSVNSSDEDETRENWYFINHNEISSSAYVLQSNQGSIHAYDHDTEQNRHKAVGYLRANPDLSSAEPKILRNAEETVNFNTANLNLFLDPGELMLPEILQKFKFSFVDGESLKPLNGGAAFLGEMSNNSQKMLGAFYSDSFQTYTSPVFDVGFSYHDLSISKQHSWVEILYSSSFVSIGGFVDQNASFKTSATHDFGIIYYDERGRAGNANFLDSVYVGGYSGMEPLREGRQGRVQIAMQLNHDPPSWARSYQMVYGGNSSIGDFIQYTTGPAFVNITDNETSLESENGIIYVSLANLQGVNEVSYSDAWGAVNKDGGKALYTYSPGDKLKIISYLDIDGETEIFPHKYEFEILGVKTMTSSTNDNPFYHTDDSGDGVHPSKVGEFLVLKNNSLAINFSYGDIYNTFSSENGFNGATAFNYWNNRTLVEIYSPKKVQDLDSRVYHETGPKYNISSSASGALSHQTNPILIEDGDVYWRRVPLNTPRYSDGVFLPLLDFESKHPRFRNYFVETNSFTDLFPGANGKSYGKPKLIFSDATETRNKASVTFSERNNYSSRFNSFTRFNPSVLPYKDLPNEYGSIMSLVNEYDSVLVIQENKVSAVPVERNILATAGGSTSLMASGKVLGTQKFYAGNYGCDTNPESVVRAGTSVYFASKKNKEVYMYSPNQGLAVVSDLGMKTFFYNLFSSAMANVDTQGPVRVVGGYDPLKDEYLLSVINDSLMAMVNYDTDDLPPLLSPIVQFEGVIEDVMYEDNGGGNDVAVALLQEDLANANNEIEELEILNNGLTLDLAAAENLLSGLETTFSTLLADFANADLYGAEITSITLPNGTVVQVLSYAQYTNVITGLIAEQELVVNGLEDDFIYALEKIGLTYNSFIGSTNAFLSLISSFEEVLDELNLQDSLIAITTSTTEITNLIPEVSTTSLPLSNGSTVSVIGVDEQDNSWMTSIYTLSLSISNLLGEGGSNSFANQVILAVNNLDETKSSLAQQLRNVLLSITSLSGPDGLILPPNQLPDNLKNFMQGSGLYGLDQDNDGVFEASEVLTEEDITDKIEPVFTAYINALTVVNTDLSTFIDSLLAVMNESSFGWELGDITSENAQDSFYGIAPYITFIENKLLAAQGSASSAIANAAAANASLTTLQNELVAVWNEAVDDGFLQLSGYMDVEIIDDFNDTLIGTLSDSMHASSVNTQQLNIGLSQYMTMLEDLHAILLTAGYAPFDSDQLFAFKLNEDNLPPDRYQPLITAVQQGLVNLKAFQQLFSENLTESHWGQQGSYYTHPSAGEGTVGLRTVSAIDITNLAEEALNGVKNAMDTIQANLVGTSIAPSNAPPSYLSQNILDLLVVDGEITTTSAANLTQYIQANGITINELYRVKQEFERQSYPTGVYDPDTQTGGQYPSSLDSSKFQRSAFDFNTDGSIGSADLLGFLLNYGSDVNDEGKIYTYETNPDGSLVEVERPDGGVHYVVIEKT
jgi:hypothetical protein